LFWWQVVAAMKRGKVVCSDNITAKMSACFAPVGVIAIANAIKDMRAMTSLNLASNCLCGIDEFGDGTFNASGNAACFSFQSQHTLAHT
jgi:hypothetical protein